MLPTHQRGETQERDFLVAISRFDNSKICFWIHILHIQWNALTLSFYAARQTRTFPFEYWLLVTSVKLLISHILTQSFDLTPHHHLTYVAQARTKKRYDLIFIVFLFIFCFQMNCYPSFMSVDRNYTYCQHWPQMFPLDPGWYLYTLFKADVQKIQNIHDKDTDLDFKFIKKIYIFSASWHESQSTSGF